jgi:hypothetical protein
MPATYTKARSPGSSKSGVSIIVDTKALSRLAADLRRAAPEAWKTTRVQLRAAGQIVADDWRARASGWSTTVPGSVRVLVTSGGNVKVRAGGPRAPVAAPAENHGRAGTFRHPLFADRNHWYDQKAHPDGAEALAAHQDEVAQAIENAITATVDRVLGGL